MQCKRHKVRNGGQWQEQTSLEVYFRRSSCRCPKRTIDNCRLALHYSGTCASACRVVSSSAEPSRPFASLTVVLLCTVHMFERHLVELSAVLAQTDVSAHFATLRLAQHCLEPARHVRELTSDARLQNLAKKHKLNQGEPGRATLMATLKICFTTAIADF